MLKILALADIHYIKEAKHICQIETRKTHLGLDAIKKIFKTIELDDIDLIVLLGDLVDNGNAEGATKDLDSIYQYIKVFNKPIIVAPGNHDPEAGITLDIFRTYEGLHEINGYKIINFADIYDEGDFVERSFKVMRDLFSSVTDDDLIVVVQHSPIYPYIDDPYPYNLQNADEVMGFYSDKNVILSLSGHAHWGIDLEEKDGVSYLTCPALCESPFKYTIISIEDREINVKINDLKDYF